ncbi:MAG TPA: glycosyltransferase family 39 protein [Blastocatellia bacterium]|nr:glycosyltransferase family 39 protein [Blastocatellia bacterium]
MVAYIGYDGILRRRRRQIGFDLLDFPWDGIDHAPHVSGFWVERWIQTREVQVNSNCKLERVRKERRRGDMTNGQSKNASQLAKQPGAYRREVRLVLSIALGIGILLRLGSAVFGDVGVYVDGASRIVNAVRWSRHPAWEGLSGLWPPLHTYVLGSVIRIWDRPVFWAKLITFACSAASLFAFNSAVKRFFDHRIASIATFLLAVCWTHIWLTSSYWVEVPYLLFVFLAVDFAGRSLERKGLRDPLLSGAFLSMAILLRNEGLLLLGVLFIWFLANVKQVRRIAAFAGLPMAVAAWYFIEPLLAGHSYLDYFRSVSGMKSAENLVGGVTERGALLEWVLMVGVCPTLFVVVPAFYELWRLLRSSARERFAGLLREPFLWMWGVQLVLYLTATIALGWRPQMRYILLYFVNLFPYAARGWLRLIEIYSARMALSVLLAGMLATQSVGWWIGRNNGLPYGWLPIQVPTSTQALLDGWVARVGKLGGVRAKIVSLGPAPLTGRWSLGHASLVDRMPVADYGLEEVYVTVNTEILIGIMPASVATADIILVDRNSSYYQTVSSGIVKAKPGTRISSLGGSIVAFLVTTRGRETFEMTQR